MLGKSNACAVNTKIYRDEVMTDTSDTDDDDDDEHNETGYQESDLADVLGNEKVLTVK